MRNNDDIQDIFEKKSALKNIVKKSTFLLVVAIGDLTFQLSRVYLLADLGLENLAASSLIYTVTNFILDPTKILTSQNAVFISQNYGAIKKLSNQDQPPLLESSSSLNNNDNKQVIKLIELNKDIGNIIRQGWYLSLFSSIPGGVLLLSSAPIINALGINKAISSKVGAYFFPVTFAVPFIMATQINERFFSAVDQEKWLLPYRTLTAAIGVGLNIVLIPRFGTTGAGLAVLIQNVASFLITTSFIAFKSNFKKFDLLNFKKYSGSYITKMLKQGLPVSSGLLLVVGTNFGISILVGHLGDLRLAIDQVLSQSFGIATTITHSVSDATNRLVAQKVGQKDFKLSKLYGNLGLSSAMLLYAPFAIVYNIIPLKVASVFIENNNMMGADDLIRYNFLLVTLSQFLVTILDTTTLNLAAFEDTFLSSVISFLAVIAIIAPLAAISAYLTNFDLYGITGSLNIGLFIAAATVASYWFKQSNKAVLSNSFSPDTDTSNAKVNNCVSQLSMFKKCGLKKEYKEIGQDEDEQSIGELTPSLASNYQQQN